MATPDRARETPDAEPDLLSLGLIAYFAGLILVVAGLLVLPAIV